MSDRKGYYKQYYKDNKEKITKQVKRWRKNNPQKIKEYNKKYRKDNPEDRRIEELKYKYGLSYEDWLKMWKSQDKKCAICSKSFVKPSNAYVDHDHKTDKVRGLLCNKCNVGLSFVEDLEFVVKAKEYLNGHIREST